MATSKTREHFKRVMFVVEQVIAANNTATKVGQSGVAAEEESKEGDPQATTQSTEEENQRNE